MTSEASGWARERIKFIADINPESLPETTDEEFTFDYVDISRVTQGSIDPNEQLMTFREAPSRARRLARPGDTIISTVRTYLRAVAEVQASESEQVFSTGFAVVRPKPNRVHPRFLTYYLQSDPLVDRVVADSVGVSYPAINASDIAHYDLWLPTIPDQRAIADFLDRETAQIDQVIVAQQELVARLAERRNAVVLQTVRGDGCEWPYRPLKHFVQRVSGSGFPVEEQGVEGLPLPFYKVSALAPAGRDGHITEVYDTVDHLTARRLGAKVVPAGSPVMAKIGAAVLLGRVRQVARDCCVDNNMVAFVTNGLMDDRFAYFALQQFDIKYFVNPGTLPFLNERSLLDAPIPVPGIEEQHVIAAELDRATTRMDTMIDAANDSIALMQERRAALISAAVTGRIDPRTGKDQAVAV